MMYSRLSRFSIEDTLPIKLGLCLVKLKPQGKTVASKGRGENTASASDNQALDTEHSLIDTLALRQIPD
jgi:hypothetical protein